MVMCRTLNLSLLWLFKAFLLIWDLNLTARVTSLTKIPNFPLPHGRGPTLINSLTENILYCNKILYVSTYLACWNINLSTDIKIQIKFTEMMFWWQFNFRHVQIIAICLLTPRAFDSQRVTLRCRHINTAPIHFLVLVAFSGIFR